MGKLLVALAILLLAGLGSLYFLDIVAYDKFIELLMQGVGVIAIAAVASAAIKLVMGSSKKGQ